MLDQGLLLQVLEEAIPQHVEEEGERGGQPEGEGRQAEDTGSQQQDLEQELEGTKDAAEKEPEERHTAVEEPKLRGQQRGQVFPSSTLRRPDWPNYSFLAWPSAVEWWAQCSRGWRRAGKREERSLPPKQKQQKEDLRVTKHGSSVKIDSEMK